MSFKTEIYVIISANIKTKNKTEKITDTDTKYTWLIIKKEKRCDFIFKARKNHYS